MALGLDGIVSGTELENSSSIVCTTAVVASAFAGAAELLANASISVCVAVGRFSVSGGWFSGSSSFEELPSADIDELLRLPTLFLSPLLLPPEPSPS